ncbi:MAG: hypothetical protein Q8Q36_00075 [bacterium]|nr:hypothetical protein [bacterium]
MSPAMNFALLAASLALFIALVVWVNERSQNEREKKAAFWWVGVITIIGIGGAFFQWLFSLVSSLLAIAVGPGTMYSIVGAAVTVVLALHCRLFYPISR